MQPEDAFKNIGLLMTAWCARLPVRDLEHNAKIKEQLVKFEKIPYYDLNDRQREERDKLNKSIVTVRTIAQIKRTVPGVDSVLKGSPRMDTGAAFMMLGTHADFSKEEDNDASFELMKLVVAARPNWNPEAGKSTAKKARKP